MESNLEEIVKLEIKVSYLEDFVNQLQEVLVNQQEEIKVLQAKVKSLTEKLREISDAVEGDIPNRKPPHYLVNILSCNLAFEFFFKLWSDLKKLLLDFFEYAVYWRYYETK